jgi:hypothetical protein
LLVACGCCSTAVACGGCFVCLLRAVLLLYGGACPAQPGLNAKRHLLWHAGEGARHGGLCSRAF